MFQTFIGMQMLLTAIRL